MVIEKEGPEAPVSEFFSELRVSSLLVVKASANEFLPFRERSSLIVAVQVFKNGIDNCNDFASKPAVDVFARCVVIIIVRVSQIVSPFLKKARSRSRPPE